MALIRKPTDAEFEAAAELAKLQRHARAPSNGGRVAALDRLHHRLAENASLYEGGELQDQRDAVVDSLVAVQEYLAKLGFALPTLSPIMRPVEALIERGNNFPDPMFAERVRSGRPNASLRAHQRTGILAALADAWLTAYADDHGKQQDKLGAAARAFQGKWFGVVTKTQLKTARDLVNQEATDHQAAQTARIYYRFIVQTAESVGMKDAISIMIRFLNDSPSTFGLGTSLIYKTPHITPNEDA